MFISRSSLWSNFDCVDADKTRVYLERSGSSPISLQLCWDVRLSSLDPFLQIIPQAIGRLKSLSVDVRPEGLRAITAHLSHPAPLLERLDIYAGYRLQPQSNPVLVSTIFNGDLSSLRVLHLDCVRTELPWRNMVNLTSFALEFSSTGNFGQLLDFFESAPRLCEIYLLFTTPVSGGGNGRLVPLDHLKKMDITACGPTSVFLNHLVIPVGAKLETGPGSDGFIIEDHIPSSIDNLKNLSSITEIHLHLDGYPSPFVQLSGPDGQLRMMAGEINNAGLVFESLARFDTSKTKRLKIDGSSHQYIDPPYPYHTLLPMKYLRTLVLSRCSDIPCAFMDALNPNTSPSKEVVCPSLEELVFVPGDVEEFDIQTVIEMATSRASRGAKLRYFKDRAELDPMDAVELRKHVLRVEYGPEVDAYDDGSDCSDEED